MNLNKIREVEDLKEELSSIYLKRDELFKEAKREFLNKSKKEFEDYFVNEGFSIEKNEVIDENGHVCEIITAKYKRFRVQISVPPSDVSYMGASSVLVLSIPSEKKEYDLRVNDINKDKVSVGTIISKKLLKENEINDLKVELADMKKNVSSKEIIFDIQIPEKHNGDTRFNKFDSLHEVLESLFNE